MGETDTTFAFDPKSQTWLAQHTFSIPNRGINFGDGVFETMVFDGCQIRFVEGHQNRLFLGLDTLGISKNQVDVSGILDFLNRHFNGKKLRVRWTIFRAGLGKYTPIENDPVQLLSVEPFFPSPQKKESAGVSEQIRLTYSKWSPCKTLNAIPYVMAGMERQQNGWDEIILLDYRGMVSEAGASTIFWEKNGHVFTPSLTCGCIAGVSRAVIIQKLIQAGVYITEGEFPLETLLAADKVWTSNVTGISYLESIGLSKFSTEPIRFLQEIFD